MCVSVCVFVPLQVYLPPTYTSLLLMIADAILYGLLAWYLDAVIRGTCTLYNYACTCIYMYMYMYIIRIHVHAHC